MRAFAATLAAVGLLCLASAAAEEPTQIKLDHPVFCLAVSPDGKTIFAAGPQKKIDSDDPASAFQPGKATLLDAKTGKLLRSFKTECPAPAVAVSPDGKRLLTGDLTRFGVMLEGKKGTAFPRVWQVESGKPAPLELDGHKDTVLGVAFFPDGKPLITASGDGTARIWDADAGKELLVLKTDHFNNGLALSKDGKRVAVAGFDTKMTVWDADTGKEAFVLDVGYSAVRAAFAPDGSLVAVCSSGVNDITLRDGAGGASKGNIVVQGDSVTGKVGDEVHKGMIKVDASKTPRTFDLLSSEAGAKPILCIYEIKGDELRFCHREARADRPTELASKEGSGLTLVTLKRVMK